MSIELDMWLILKQAERQEGSQIDTIYVNGKELKIYMESVPNSQDVNFYAISSSGQRVVEHPYLYDEVRGTLRPLGPPQMANSYTDTSIVTSNELSVSTQAFIDHTSVFNKAVHNFLVKHNIKERTYDQPDFKQPQFSDEEKKLFNEDIFENLEHMDPIGEGVFRKVYDLGDFVLKVIHGLRSLYTARKVNESEANHEAHQEFPELTVKTYKHDPNYAWIIQDKVKGLSDWDDAKILKYFNLVDDDFIRLSGRECENKISEALDQIIKGFKDIDNLKAKRMIEKGRAENFNRTKKNIYDRKIGHFDPKIIQLGKMVMKYNIDRDDFKSSNFGETADGRIVVIDLGTHYSIGVL